MVANLKELNVDTLLQFIRRKLRHKNLQAFEEKI
jgi:hypothetical protein